MWNGLDMVFASIFLKTKMWMQLLIKQTENYAMELSTVGNVISEWHRKGTFDFTEIVEDLRLKR